MAEKRSYNSKLNAKGLEQSVSEEQARHMATHQGSTYLFIVQAHAGPKVVNEDGSEVVSLIPDLVELVPAEHGERLRRYQRALYLSRPDQFGQAAFEEATPGERDADAAGADVEALVETDEKGEPAGIWTPDADGCPSPGCILAAEHDGDHDIPPVEAEADEQEPEGDGTDKVVAFSGKR